MGQRPRVVPRRPRRGRAALAGRRAPARDDVDRAGCDRDDAAERGPDEGRQGGDDRDGRRLPPDRGQARPSRALLGRRPSDAPRGLHEVVVGDGRDPGRAVPGRLGDLPARLLPPEPRRLEGQRLPAEGFVAAADDLLHGRDAVRGRRRPALAGEQLVAGEHALVRRAAHLRGPRARIRTRSAGSPGTSRAASTRSGCCSRSSRSRFVVLVVGGKGVRDWRRTAAVERSYRSTSKPS